LYAVYKNCIFPVQKFTSNQAVSCEAGLIAIFIMLSDIQQGTALKTQRKKTIYRRGH
jgi:hypothetical protein